MKFKNKYTNEVVEAKGYTQEFAYSHNSNYELVDTKDPKKMNKDELVEYLTSLGVEATAELKKDELLSLIPAE